MLKEETSNGKIPQVAADYGATSAEDGGGPVHFTGISSTALSSHDLGSQNLLQASQPRSMSSLAGCHASLALAQLSAT